MATESTQKWEYIVLTVVILSGGGPSSTIGGSARVTGINGEDRVEVRVEKGKVDFSGCIELHKYLNRLGAEGWALVTAETPTTALAVSYYTLMRPKQG